MGRDDAAVSAHQTILTQRLTGFLSIADGGRETDFVVAALRGAPVPAIDIEPAIGTPKEVRTQRNPSRSGLVDVGGRDVAAVVWLGADVDKGRHLVGTGSPLGVDTGEVVVAGKHYGARLHVGGVGKETGKAVVALHDFDK